MKARAATEAASPAPRWVSDIVLTIVTGLVVYLVYIVARHMLGAPLAYIVTCLWGLSCAIGVYRDRA